MLERTDSLDGCNKLLMKDAWTADTSQATTATKCADTCNILTHTRTVEAMWAKTGCATKALDSAKARQWAALADLGAAEMVGDCEAAMKEKACGTATTCSKQLPPTPSNRCKCEQFRTPLSGGEYYATGCMAFRWDQDKQKCTIFRYPGMAYILDSFSTAGCISGITELTDDTIRTAVASWFVNWESVVKKSKLGHLSRWDVRKVKDMSGLFKGKAGFDDDLSRWDVTAVTTMQEMFKDAGGLDQDLSAWANKLGNLANVKDVFAGTDALHNCNKLRIAATWGGQHPAFKSYAAATGWTTDKMACFLDDTNFHAFAADWLEDAKAIEARQKTGPGPIAAWDVSRVKDMGGAFEQAAAFKGDVSQWSTGSVTNMDRLFFNATRFDTNIDSWQTSNVVSINGMFQLARSYSQPLSSWDTGRLESFAQVFFGADKFGGKMQDMMPTPRLTSKNVAAAVDDWVKDKDAAAKILGSISGWKVSEVKNMAGLFKGRSEFNADLSRWSTAAATSMAAMFDGCTQFDGNISLWKVGKVTSMSKMFRSASKFDGAVGAWDTARLVKMDSIFESSPKFAQDISRWSTGSVVDMSSAFTGAAAFNSAVGAWDLGNTATLAFAFAGCESFDQDVSRWETAKVVDMEQTFSGAAKFNSDISKWAVGAVQTMRLMFFGALKFAQDLSKWKLHKSIDVGTFCQGEMLYVKRNAASAAYECHVREQVDFKLAFVAGKRAGAGVQNLHTYDKDKNFITKTNYKTAPKLTNKSKTTVSRGTISDVRHRLEPPKGWGGVAENIEFFLNSGTGVINVEFYKKGTYELDLTAVDKGGETFLVERHVFDATEPQEFNIAKTGARVPVDDNVKVRHTPTCAAQRRVPVPPACSTPTHPPPPLSLSLPPPHTLFCVVLRRAGARRAVILPACF